ncbi:flavin reductase family protein [Nocardioides cavernaquae]|uniref:Flavin reductase n=1 Tax=Nocardioides cavernaquae TaxID=2321396 RepID=A0A3A5H3J0_9ACTN|nr:flavin reductase family protein [Nocardioides cavernaquae]RJS45333.1 flavin reductase [Nocardioides cavernaquae]
MSARTAAVIGNAPPGRALAEVADSRDASVALDPQALRGWYGAFPSGVVAVAAHVDGQLTGIAASSFTSVSLDPPLVSISVARTSNTWPSLRKAGQIGISVLADRQDIVCRQLAGPVPERFAGLRFSVTSGGAVLLRESVANFTTTLHSEIDAGDHVIVLLEVRGAEDGEGKAPLIFHRSVFAQLDRSGLDPSELDGRINGEPVH